MGPTLKKLALVVVASAMAAACGAPVDHPALTASVTQSRAAQARGSINVLLTNRSDKTVRVDALVLDDIRFAPVAPTARRVTLHPGVADVLVPLELGQARCAGTLGSPAVIVDEHEVPIDEAGEAVLDALVEDACALAAIERTSSLSYAEVASVASSTAVDVVLRVERRSGNRSVTVDSVGSNVIFSVSADRVPATLDVDDDVLDLIVRISADRCEPHALAESKKTFQLPVWVALDDEAPAFVELTATGAVRAALDRALNEGCAASG